MWKSAAGVQLEIPHNEDDDWETDPDFINDVTEEEQRWGSRTIPGSGRTAAAIDMNQLREEVAEADALHTKKQLQEGPNSAFGYGGKFGIQKDRMDQCAVGHDYVAVVNKHVSQTDYNTGFGGKFGVQTDRVDKSASNYDNIEKLQQHASQKDYAAGFGGRYGIQKDRQDKSALGWDHKETLQKHESQTDYAVGFGGKFGVQKDRQDKCAVGFDHSESIPKHHSQVDYSKGFGGKFGIEKDRVDKSACSFNEISEEVGTNYKTIKPEIGSMNSSSIRAKFENMAKQSEQMPKNSAPKKPVKWQVKSQPLLQQQQQQTAQKTEENNKNITSTENPSGQVRESNENPSDSNDTTGAAEVPVATIPATREDDVTSKSDSVVKATNHHDEQRSLRHQTDDEKEEFQVKYAECKQINEDEHNRYADVTSNDVADEIEDIGYTAVALYDYQASAEDEISFDPDDLITNIEMIDEGWWRGYCKGQYGLFPANYVSLQVTEENHMTTEC